MGAARLAMTMAVVAIGAGAILALTTIPTLAPYQEKERKAPLVALPDSQIRPAHDDGRGADSEQGYGLARPFEDEREEGSLRVGTDDGRIVIELPRWIEEHGSWFSRGQRVWREWIEPQDQSDGQERYEYAPRHRDRYEDEQRYAPQYAPRYERDRERERDSGEGYASRDEEFSPRREYRQRQDEGLGYTNPNRLIERNEEAPARNAPYATERQPRSEAPPVSTQKPADAAAIAAARAREAARDVYAAEAAGQ